MIHKDKSKVLEHIITVKFICPIKEEEIIQKINNPTIYNGPYFNHISVNCKLCGETHYIEI